MWNIDKWSSTRSKRRVETPHQPGTRNPFKRITHIEEDFDSKVICYESYLDVEDLNEHNPNYSELVEAQW